MWSLHGCWPMARKRSVSPEFFMHEGLGGISPHARLLFVCLWTLADREGRLRWVPMQVHAAAFPYEPGLDVAAILGELVSVECVRLYTVAGKGYLLLPGFTTWQKPHHQEPDSRHPAPEQDGTSENLAAGFGESLNTGPTSSRPNRPLSSVLYPLSSDPLNNNTSPGAPSVDAPRPPSQRSKDAKDLDQHWQDLSGARPKPNSAASKKRLARWARYLKDHSIEDLRLLTEYISESAWWRGENNTGSDLFKAGPGKWLNDPEKAEARIEEARAWDKAGRPAQPAQQPQSNRPPWERTLEDVKAEVDANLRAKGLDPDALLTY